MISFWIAGNRYIIANSPDTTAIFQEHRRFDATPNLNSATVRLLQTYGNSYICISQHASLFGHFLGGCSGLSFKSSNLPVNFTIRNSTTNYFSQNYHPVYPTYSGYDPYTTPQFSPYSDTSPPAKTEPISYPTSGTTPGPNVAQPTSTWYTPSSS